MTDFETMQTVIDIIFLGSKITAASEINCNHEIKRRLLSFLGRKVMTNLGSILESRDVTLLTKVLIVKAMIFPVVMYGCESWAIKKADCRRIAAGENSWESLGLQGDPTSQSERKSTLNIIERIDAEALVLRPPDAKSWLIWKDPDAGKDWRQEEKRTTEDEMVGWHHRLSGYEFEQTPGVDDGRGGLACCSPWGCKESDTTEQLSWTDTYIWYAYLLCSFIF